MSEHDDDDTEAERSTLQPQARLENGELPSFAAFFASLGDGEVQARATAALKEMAEAIHDTALASHSSVKVKGKLTVELDFTYEQGLTEVSAKLKSKLPDLAMPRSVLWLTARKNFSGQNPRQMQLFGPRVAD